LGDRLLEPCLLLSHYGLIKTFCCQVGIDAGNAEIKTAARPARVVSSYWLDPRKYRQCVLKLVQQQARAAKAMFNPYCKCSLYEFGRKGLLLERIVASLSKCKWYIAYHCHQAVASSAYIN